MKAGLAFRQCYLNSSIWHLYWLSSWHIKIRKVPSFTELFFRGQLIMNVAFWERSRKLSCRIDVKISAPHICRHWIGPYNCKLLKQKSCTGQRSCQIRRAWASLGNFGDEGQIEMIIVIRRIVHWNINSKYHSIAQNVYKTVLFGHASSLPVLTSFAFP